MCIVYRYHNLIPGLQSELGFDGKFMLWQQLCEGRGRAGGLLCTATATTGLQAFDPNLAVNNFADDRLFFDHDLSYCQAGLIADSQSFSLASVSSF